MFDSFKAELNGDKQIVISANTYWSCKVEGNFKLSKYNGEGDCIIDIIIPNDIASINGSVYFSYGKGFCKYPEIDVYLTNECFIDTYPKYIICEDEKVINVYYNAPRELYTISIFCYSGWHIGNNESNFVCMTDKNELRIISKNKDGELEIIPNFCENEKIIIKLVKKL